MLWIASWSSGRTPRTLIGPQLACLQVFIQLISHRWDQYLIDKGKGPSLLACSVNCGYFHSQFSITQFLHRIPVSILLSFSLYIFNSMTPELLLVNNPFTLLAIFYMWYSELNMEKKSFEIQFLYMLLKHIGLVRQSKIK